MGPDVSIHARVKRATSTAVLTSTASVRGFNPRPREAGDSRLADRGAIIGVSIHARVKRATAIRSAVDSCDEVSIHARVKRATP